MVIVAMCVDCEAFRFLPAKQRKVRRINTDLLRPTMTTDVMIQADNFVRAGHNQVQIVRNHEDAALVASANLVDEFVKFSLAADVDTLCRLVKDQ